MDDKYEIMALLGKGHTGGVYQAHDTILDREIALRRYYTANGEKPCEAWSTKFLETSEFLTKLQHPNLLPIFDAGIDADGAFSVSPLLEGTYLSDSDPIRPMCEASAHSMAEQLLGALAEVHTAGGVHGALTPSSVLISKSQRSGLHFTIMDLGLASLRPDYLAHCATDDPIFLPIDRLERNPISPQSDCHLLGHLIYIALLGGHPWAGKTRAESSELHLNEPLPPISDYRDDISEEFQQWLDRLTSNNPELRYKDATQALRDLKPHIAQTTAVRSILRFPRMASHQLISKGLVATILVLFCVTTATALLVYNKVSAAQNAPLRISPEENNAFSPEESTPLAPPPLVEIPSSEERIYTTSSLTQHPRSACKVSDTETRDWTVYTGPAPTQDNSNHPEANVIGDLEAIGEFTAKNHPVGNLVFFNTFGKTYRPNLYAQCHSPGDGWRIPLNLPPSFESDLKATLHFSTWNCNAAVCFKSDKNRRISQKFNYADEAPFTSYAVTYTIPHEEHIKTSKLHLNLVTTSGEIDKPFGLSLSSIIIE